jgi:2-keto-4-pentenoate hydratase/2-oxohepta-3-ene-1,7-dioic acid hydratase in catechol pathway
VTDYRILAFTSDDGPRAGIAIGDAVFDVADSTDIAAWRSTDAIFADWQRAASRLAALAASGNGKPARLRAGAAAVAPLQRPGAIFCAGANYKDHVLEMARAQNIAPEPDPHVVGLKAWHFIKLAACIAAPDEKILLPRRSRRVDWEAELALVIGRTAKEVPAEGALDYVAGYMVANDLSARDLGKRPNVPDQSPFQQDWVAHKCFDQSCPLGPWVVPAAQIQDPQNLGIQSWVNGVLKQDSNTSAMIFTIAEQISHLSEKLTLHPGDVILTGTPAGVGTSRGEFLKPGDVVRIRVEGVGEITNTMA